MVPTDAEAALQTAWNALRQQITLSEQRVRDLEARLKLNRTSEVAASFNPTYAARLAAKKAWAEANHSREMAPPVPEEVSHA